MMKEIIEKRLTETFHPSYLRVIDESDQHIGHPGHQGGGRHFAIEISAPQLQEMSRVAAHRAIYAVFNDLMPDRIHALKIKIL